MKYKILRTDGNYDFHNNSAITELPEGAIPLTDQEWENKLQPSESQLFQSAKTAKISQLNINRDAASLTPTSDIKAREVIVIDGESDELGNEFYFLFRVTNTNNPASNPAIILNTAIRKGADNPNYYLRYSGIIIDGDTTRKGYVAITGGIANSLSDHLELRNLANIDYANNIEKEINACTTIEELNSINIEF
jgi:hypothetical protein